MIRQDYNRIDAKRRSILSHKKKQFASAQYAEQEYKHRLNFYDIPPTADITLEEFEEWAIARLKVLSELETCTFRNMSPDETASYMNAQLQKHLPLQASTSKSSTLHAERMKDHYSHFILRLAFAATEDLRRRFVRLETMLFRLRWANDDLRERKEFVSGLGLEWDWVGEKEKKELETEDLLVAPGGRVRGGGSAGAEEEGWFKVEWEKVPELIEQRKVLVRRGMAYVPAREQMSMVVAEFSRRLEQAMELTSRALPRLDEDDRLAPILAHLSHSFVTPTSTYDPMDPSSLDPNSSSAVPAPTANNIPTLATQHFPLCMSHLQHTLNTSSHLKHFGRLQYTLFLKGIRLSLDEALRFWRNSFRLMTDEKFNKEYRYNVRHAYGDVGGDANRRGRGYTPYSCHKILTEPLPGPGQAHGCPYRTFTPDNLIGMLSRQPSGGVKDPDVLRAVREDVSRQRYHVACNRVFEATHKKELKKVKEEGTMGLAQLDTLVHPNQYYERSVRLKALWAAGRDGGQRSGNGKGDGEGDVRMEDV